MASMGWRVERGRGGSWFAVKVKDRTPYGTTGPVRVRHELTGLPQGAGQKDAEREVVRLFARNILN